MMYTTIRNEGPNDWKMSNSKPPKYGFTQIFPIFQKTLKGNLVKKSPIFEYMYVGDHEISEEHLYF